MPQLTIRRGDVLKTVHSWLSAFMGIKIPSELKRSNALLLHLTDTPTLIYHDLKKLIDKLSPKIIVHTGDMVDNIKLELFPQRSEEFKHQAARLLQILEHSNAEKIYICPGNHDHPEILQQLVTRSQIVPPHFTFHYGNSDYSLSHNAQNVILSKSNFNFFGHDLTLPSQLKGPVKFLNGLEAIYVIDLETEKIHQMPYPFGTNDSRLSRTHLGM